MHGEDETKAGLFSSTKEEAETGSMDWQGIQCYLCVNCAYNFLLPAEAAIRQTPVLVTVAYRVGVIKLRWER